MRVIVLGATRMAVEFLSRCATEGVVAKAGSVGDISADTAVIDASHPFDEAQATEGFRTATSLGAPWLAIRRAPWSPTAADDWICVGDAASSAKSLRPGWRVVFLTLGRDRMKPFFGRPETCFIVRAIGAEDAELPLANYRILPEPGPYTAESEAALMQAHSVDALVTRNVGGAGAWPKVAAARALGLPVVMVAAPPPPGPVVTEIDAALAWAQALVANGNSP